MSELGVFTTGPEPVPPSIEGAEAIMHRRLPALHIQWLGRLTKHHGGVEQSLTEGLAPGPQDFETLASFEAHGYVKDAPTLQEAANDASRQNSFNYHPVTSSSRSDVGITEIPTRTLTEQEGLGELNGFLNSAVDY